MKPSHGKSAGVEAAVAAAMAEVEAGAAGVIAEAAVDVVVVGAGAAVIAEAAAVGVGAAIAAAVVANATIERHALSGTGFSKARYDSIVPRFLFLGGTGICLCPTRAATA